MNDVKVRSGDRNIYSIEVKKTSTIGLQVPVGCLGVIRPGDSKRSDGWRTSHRYLWFVTTSGSGGMPLCHPKGKKFRSADRNIYSIEVKKTSTIGFFRKPIYFEYIWWILFHHASLLNVNPLPSLELGHHTMIIVQLVLPLHINTHGKMLLPTLLHHKVQTLKKK